MTKRGCILYEVAYKGFQTQRVNYWSLFWQFAETIYGYLCDLSFHEDLSLISLLEKPTHVMWLLKGFYPITHSVNSCSFSYFSGHNEDVLPSHIVFKDSGS